ncbi:hypothetical protein D3X11_01065 [Streptococcus sp. X16XC17]|nr:hypothetical protein D3X11_01065 [Streptococcus sp. X16XC17]
MVLSNIKVPWYYRGATLVFLIYMTVFLLGIPLPVLVVYIIMRFRYIKRAKQQKEQFKKYPIC